MTINLTPHPVRVILPDGGVREIPSNGVARVSQTVVLSGTVDGIPVIKSAFGPVVGLPEEGSFVSATGEIISRWQVPVGDDTSSPITGIIVSAMVRLACPDRRDLFSPAELVRDNNGAVIGCRSLEGNL